MEKKCDDCRGTLGFVNFDNPGKNNLRVKGAWISEWAIATQGACGTPLLRLKNARKYLEEQELSFDERCLVCRKQVIKSLLEAGITPDSDEVKGIVESHFGGGI